MSNKSQNCPQGHGAMKLAVTTKEVSFRGLELICPIEQYVCEECGLEVATSKQAGAMQRTIADIYRTEKGLLTGQEIKNRRKDLDMTQQNLADDMSVGIASIKRWEGGIIQTPGMDKLLRQSFWPRQREATLTGNRQFSIERVKLALVEFDDMYEHDLLADNDKLLYSAKPLWYADMVAHRDLGKSISGATYAALPKGPQLNNYRELVSDIMGSDEKQAEPLSPEEKKIIKRVYDRFPGKTDAYHASHREKIWKEKRTGEIIPYMDSSELFEM